MKAWIPIALLVSCAIAIVALSGVLSSPGGNPAALAHLQNAARTTARSTGAHIALAMTTTGGSASVNASGSGEVDPATGEASFAMSVTSGAGQTALAERMTHGTIYVESPQLAEQLGQGHRWVSINLGELRKALGVAPGNTSLGVDPNEYLNYLRSEGAQVSARGKQTLRGEPTTRYSGTINLVQAVQATGGADASKAAETLSSQLRDASSVPVEAWVDNGGRLRKVAMSLESTHGQLVSIVVEYFDFGPIRPVTAPAPGEVFDLTGALASRLG